MQMFGTFFAPLGKTNNLTCSFKQAGNQAKAKS